MARKWQKFAARIVKESVLDQESCTSLSQKGHFVVHSADQKRFMIPLSYLGTDIIKQLLGMVEDEYGLPGNGPITLPCDSLFIEYAISLIRRNTTKDVEKPLLKSITSSHYLPSSYRQGVRTNQSVVCSF